MGRFITDLETKYLGNGYYELLSPLIYESKTLGYVVAPTGFRTNFASVPRLPIVYMIFGGLGAKEATIHDWLYTPPHVKDKDCNVTVSRAIADKVFRGARYACDRIALEDYEQVSVISISKNVWAYIGAWMMWVAVRLFGWRHWRK